MTDSPARGNPEAPEPRIEMVDPHTAQRWMERGEAVLIDVREPQEFAMEHIAGATSAPLSAFDPMRLPENADKRLLVMCASGVRCGIASEILMRAGVSRIYRLAGGLMAWKAGGGPVVQGN